MKTIIFDGTNVVRSMYNASTGFNFDREANLSNSLVRAIESLKQEEDIRTEIYFDGPKREIYRGGGNGMLDVFFSRHKIADDLIVNSVEGLVNGYDHEVLVITQDKQLQKRCKIYGAHVMSTREFLHICGEYIEAANEDEAYA